MAGQPQPPGAADARQRRAGAGVRDSVPGILVVFSAEGRILHWNAAAHRTFRLSFDAVVGKSFQSCGIRWLDNVEAIDALFASQDADRRSEHGFDLNGTKRWLGVCMHTVPHADGTIGYLLSGADITSRREADEQNRQTHKLEAIGQLAAGIAHEINTPTQYVGDNITFLRDAWESLEAVLQHGKALRESPAWTATPSDAATRYDRAVDKADLEFVLPEFPRALEQALEGTQRIAHIVCAMKEFSHPVLWRRPTRPEPRGRKTRS